MMTPKPKTVALVRIGKVVGEDEGTTDGLKVGEGKGVPVGKKVVSQTPLHELSQVHIAAPVNVQFSQQVIQLHLLERNAFDPKVVTEFGKVTALVKPEHP
jgi:hypothetical protein